MKKGYCIFHGLYEKVKECPICSSGNCATPLERPLCTRCVKPLVFITDNGREIIGLICGNCAESGGVLEKTSDSVFTLRKKGHKGGQGPPL